MNEEIVYQLPDLNIINAQIEFSALIMLLIIITEVFIDIFLSKKRNYKKTLANFSFSISNQIIGSSCGKFVAGIGVLLVSKFSLFKVEVNWWTWILALLIVDLSFYWIHRAEHRVRLLWVNHSVHHSSTELNLTVSLRLGWFEDFIMWIILIPIVYFGFHPSQAIVASEIVTLYKIWLHTNNVSHPVFLKKILNTRFLHQVHHDLNQNYIYKNYGGILIIWDTLFGTYESEIEKVVYRVTDSNNIYAPVKINFIEYSKTLSYLRNSQGFFEILQSILGPPEWKPKAFMDKHN